MKTRIIGKNVEITEAMREKIEDKLNRLSKYAMIDDDAQARVVCRVYPVGQKIEVTIPTKYAVLRAEVKSEDIYSAIDKAIDKLEDQMRRQKTRLSRKGRGKEKFAEALADIEMLEEDGFNDEVVRTKSLLPDEMDIDEAIMRMEMLNHNFFIYKDEDTNNISVVYKRADGGYGCIETE